MKNLLLFIALFTALSAKSQTRDYYPFPEGNASWNVNMTQAQCFMGGFLFQDYSITFAGDTVIENLTYHKLHSPFVEVYMSGGCDQSIFPGYKGAIRQDTANRKVYFVPPTFSSEQLLYDFTLQVGDTVKGYLEAFISEPDTVTAIDSVMVAGNYRKRWLINPCYEFYLIEGIGSTYGLLQAYPGCATDMDYYSIVCFNQNGQSVYPVTSPECNVITSINNIFPEDFRVYPNPSSGTFTIDFCNRKKISEIRLTDMPGRLVYQKKINNQTTVNIEGLPVGTYILTIVDNENRTSVRKVVVER
jgi:hypothetical protein